ncbi:hypothetical protein ACYOEI_25930, partial [Singulisphaera rosea]
QLEDHGALADDERFLASLAADAGDLKNAILLGRRAVASARKAEDADEEIDSLVALSNDLSRSGASTEASTILDEALTISRGQSTPADQVRLLILAADVSRQAHRDDHRTKLLAEAEAVARKQDNGALVRMVAEARERSR